MYQTLLFLSPSSQSFLPFHLSLHDVLQEFGAFSVSRLFLKICVFSPSSHSVRCSSSHSSSCSPLRPSSPAAAEPGPPSATPSSSSFSRPAAGSAERDPSVSSSRPSDYSSPVLTESTPRGPRRPAPLALAVGLSRPPHQQPSLTSPPRPRLWVVSLPLPRERDQ